MNKSLSQILVCSYLLGVSSFVLGQQVNTLSNNEAYTDSSKKSMSVIAFGDEASAEIDPIYYKYQGEMKALCNTAGSISPNMPMPKGELMNIYQKLELPIKGSTKTKTDYRNIGNVSLISGSRSIIILIIPTDLTKEKIRGHAFKDSSTIHKEGTARAFNMTKKIAAIRTGNEVLKLPVRESGIIKWKAVAFNSVSYKVAIEGKKAETWDIIQSTESAASPNMRTFIFITGNITKDSETVTSSTFFDPIPDKDAGKNGDTP